jgi:hypothetical protein
MTGGGSAEAATTLIECDAVHGTAKVTPPLSITPLPTAIAPKSTKNAVFGCTGALSGFVGGSAIGLSGKVTSFQTIKTNSTPITLGGNLDCNVGATDPSEYPASGVLKMTYSGGYTSPTGVAKKYISSTYVRLGSSGIANLPDALSVHGIVTKGPGFGGDVDGAILQHPIPLVDGPTDANTTVDVPTDAGPTTDSLDAGAACIGGGGGTIASVRFDTDGPGLLTLIGDPTAVLDSSIAVSLP